MNGCINLEEKSKPVYSVLEWNKENTQCLVVRRRMVWKRGKLKALGYRLPNINPSLTLRPKIWIKAERLSFFNLDEAMRECLNNARWI